jgi:Tfp pilus assembly protein PilF
MVRRRVIILVLAAISAAAPARAQHLADERSRREAIQFYRTGLEFFSAERFDRAAEEFTKAIEKDPLFTLAHYHAGQSYMNLKRFASAIKAFKDCLESTRTLYGLAETNKLEVEKQRDDEIREMRESLDRISAMARKNPNSGGYQAMMMRAEQHLHDLENQRPSLSSGYRPPAEVLLSLGSAYYRTDQLEAAEAQWKAAIESNPKFGEAHNNIAVIYMQTGRFDLAEQELKLAEKNGFRVNPQFKADLKNARSARK